MYRFLTWAVGVLALGTVLGAIGYDLSTERISVANAAPVSAAARPAGEISNDGVERLVVIPLQPADTTRIVVKSSGTGPLVEATREEMGAAVRLHGPDQAFLDNGAAGAWVELPANVVRRLAGGMARITVWARSDRQLPTAQFALSLSIDGSFNGWNRFPVIPPNYESYSFLAPVPASAAGKALRVLILPDTDMKGGALSASHLIVDRILKPGEPEPDTATTPAPQE